MRIKSSEEDGVGEIDLTPMIDVVFLLVIFFMVTTSFIEESKVYKIELPKASKTAKPQTISQTNTAILAVSLDGRYFLNIDSQDKEIKELTEVVEKLKIRQSKADKLEAVILKCDAKCEYEKYLQAKNAIRMAGIELIFEEVETN